MRKILDPVQRCVLNNALHTNLGHTFSKSVKNLGSSFTYRGAQIYHLQTPVSVAARISSPILSCPCSYWRDAGHLGAWHMWREMTCVLYCGKLSGLRSCSSSVSWWKSSSRPLWSEKTVVRVTVGPGCPPAASPDFSSSPSFRKQRLRSLLLPPLTGFRASFHINSLLCDVWWHTCLRANERLPMSPSDRSVSTDSSPIKHKNQSQGNTMHACPGGKIFFCFNLRGITMVSRVIFYST